MKTFLSAFALFLLNISGFSQTTFSCTSAGTTCPCTYGTSQAEFYAGYFADNQSYFSANTPSITRGDATINFTADNSWGNIVPPATGSNANPDTYSTRWSGRIFLAAGTYSFWLTSDDASWFWLGGNALVVNPTSGTAFINNGGLHSAATVMAVAIFTADCLQDFKVHFGEQGGQNRCNLEYACSSPAIARQAVPSNVFCPCMSIANLPISLTDFYGVPNKDNIVLRWGTASEQNNLRFNVYKSTDGSKWTELGEQKGSGTTNASKNYQMLDNSPSSGINYYYLSQTDHDGTTKKFDVITVDFSNNSTYIKLFPNPFTDKFSIVSVTEWKSSDVVTVFDALGSPVFVPVSKTNKFNLDLNTTELAKGNYIVKIQTAHQVIIKRLVKE